MLQNPLELWLDLDARKLLSHPGDQLRLLVGCQGGQVRCERLKHPRDGAAAGFVGSGQPAERWRAVADRSGSLGLDRAYRPTVTDLWMLEQG